MVADRGRLELGLLKVGVRVRHARRDLGVVVLPPLPDAHRARRDGVPVRGPGALGRARLLGGLRRAERLVRLLCGERRVPGGRLVHARRHHAVRGPVRVLREDVARREAQQEPVACRPQVCRLVLPELAPPHVRRVRRDVRELLPERRGRRRGRALEHVLVLLAALGRPPGANQEVHQLLGQQVAFRGGRRPCLVVRRLRGRGRRTRVAGGRRGPWLCLPAARLELDEQVLVDFLLLALVGRLLGIRRRVRGGRMRLLGHRHLLRRVKHLLLVVLELVERRDGLLVGGLALLQRRPSRSAVRDAGRTLPQQAPRRRFRIPRSDLAAQHRAVINVLRQVRLVAPHAVYWPHRGQQARDRQHVPRRAILREHLHNVLAVLVRVCHASATSVPTGRAAPRTPAA